MNNLATVVRRRSRTLFFTIVALCGLTSPAAGASIDDEAARAQALLDAWNTQGAPACLAMAADCPRYGDSLYNAARAFQSAGELNKAIAVRTMLVDPKYHLDATDIGKKTLFQLAEDYKLLTEYAKSAEFAETAVAASPTAAEAPDALMDAVLFRMALGETDKAVKNAELYDKLFGAKKPAEALKVWQGTAAIRLERGEFKEAKAILESIMDRVDRYGDVREKFLSHAYLGRVFAKLNDQKGAEKQYTLVRAFWGDAEMQKRALAEANTNPRNLGKIIDVVGEALFFFAEQKRKEADAIKYPGYKGSPNQKALMKHINTKLVNWIKEKRPAIEAAEKEYRKILDLRPAPPPQWVIASASRVGKMWATFVSEFRAAPIPAEWKTGGKIPGSKTVDFEDLRRAYYAALDEASEPQRQVAKTAFKTCVDYSVKFQYHDEFSRSCEVWLEKHYNKEFVHVDEIIPALRPAVIPMDRATVLPDFGGNVPSRVADMVE